MKKNTDRMQHKIRKAIHALHRQYYRYPWIFMTEADVKCTLYSELLKYSAKKAKGISLDVKGRRIEEGKYGVFTRALHSELSSFYRKSTKFADLSLINPRKVTFWIKRRKFNRKDGSIPVWDWNWKPKDSIGIEIKFNRGLGAPENSWKRSLIRDMKKLKHYKRGWLLFVDQKSLFLNKEEWREFMERVIRDSNYGSAKKTLNAFYMSPKIKTAFPYKPFYRAF